MIHAGRTVPRCADVPFHVGVIGKEFAIQIKRHVVRIAEAHGDQLKAFAVLVRAGDPTAGGHAAFGVTASIPHARNDVVFRPDPRHGAVFQLGRYLGGVAGDDV